ncbi:MAG: 2-oxo acid dehydrogenase subunit E2, partial [Chloroflexia bacterium]|nr:2-oxo acid dehydrogenase subunit E2 [Chloroflexia bacterium]
MAKTVVMPQMGYDMDAGTLLRWIKQEGDQVTRGEAIAEIETDKVNIEIEAFDSGILRKTLITEGQTVPVGEAIAIIGEEGEEIDVPESAEAPPSTNGKEPPPQAAEAEEETSEESMTPPVGSTESETIEREASKTADEQPSQTVDRDPGERIRASPLVRRLSEEHGIDLSQVNGTGPHGRIVKRDIEGMVSGDIVKPAARAEEAAPAAQEAPAPSAVAPEPIPTQGGETQELTRIRQTIGKRMAQSFQHIPHFYVSVQINMDASLALRKEVNGSLEDASKISVNDLVVKATAMALQKFPVLNSSYVDGKMELHENIDINIAVAIEGGLISPFIPGADKKSLGEIARMTKDLGGRAKEGKLKPDEYAGGTFTISNLGMFGEIDSFLAIINPPQAAILAIGTATKQPVWNPNTEEFDPTSRMSITMSADHRLTDGAEVAQYLDELKGLLENPM